MSQNNINIVLLSASDVKYDACKKFAECFIGESFTIERVDIPDTPDRPGQPVGETETWNAAHVRIKTYHTVSMERRHNTPNTVIVAIENGITKDKETGMWYDICAIYVETQDYNAPIVFSKIKVLIEPKYISAYLSYANEHVEKTGNWNVITFGDYIVNHHSGKMHWPKNNWMYYCAGIDRKSQIVDGLTEAIVKTGLLRRLWQSSTTSTTAS